MPPQTTEMQARLQTQDFWTNLYNNKQADELFDLDTVQIDNARAFLSKEQRDELRLRKDQNLAAIRNDSIVRYPVQLAKPVQKTFSAKYENKVSDSKRKREQKMAGTVLHRKKLNAQDVEKAVSTHQNEKNSLLETVRQKMQDPSNSEYLNGHSVDEIMSKVDISDLSEFLVNDDAHMAENIKILAGEQSDPTGVLRCIEQFKNLDLSADLSTDKALAKDAGRLEKVTGKTMAMINLIDRHPEILEGMGPRQREEFQGKLDRAAALLNYYDVRKGIITDDYYRNHKNSEISMRFIPKPKGLDDEGEQNYLKQQNLTRKIWDAEQCASVMNRYVPRQKIGSRFYEHNIYETDQKDVEKDVADWKADLTKNYNASRAVTKQAEQLPFDTNTRIGGFFAAHYKTDDKYYQAIIGAGQKIAGTNDSLLDMCRNYTLFANWKGLTLLSDDEFDGMMDDLKSFTETVTDTMTPKQIENLREKQLNAYRAFKEILMRETPLLQQKYGGGLLVAEPSEILDHELEIWEDAGNLQTITDSMKLLKKYGILDETNPKDKEMEHTMNYMMSALTGATSAMNTLVQFRQGKEQTYADTMRISTLSYQMARSAGSTSEIVGVRDIERKLETNLKVHWNPKPQEETSGNA